MGGFSCWVVAEKGITKQEVVTLGLSFEYGGDQKYLFIRRFILDDLHYFVRSTGDD